MNKNFLISNFALAFLCVSSLYAHKPCEDEDPCIVNTIVYLEDETDIDLGFDTADYLPEDFDPHTFYFDINSIEFLVNDEINIELAGYLPSDFNPYAHPEDFRSISYIDPDDLLEPVVKLKQQSNRNIDAYISK